MLEFTDDVSLLKGRYRADVYEGDVRRERLPLWQSVWNMFADIRWRLFRLPASHYYWGRVLNHKVGEFGGDNLVVTVGKQVLMDRLYGLSAVAAVSRMGVGTSNTAAAVGNTSLTGGVFKVFDATPIRSSLTVTSITTFATGEANIAWAEMGQDNATTLLSRVAPIGPFTKTSAVSIVLSYALTIA